MTQATTHYEVDGIQVWARRAPDGGHMSGLVIGGVERDALMWENYRLEDVDGRLERVVTGTHAKLYRGAYYSSEVERDLTPQEVTALEQVGALYPYSPQHDECSCLATGGPAVHEGDADVACEDGRMAGAAPADLWN